MNTRHGQNEKARHHLRRAGYSVGGAAKKADVAEMVHEHERKDHPDTPLTKFKAGGAVEGNEATGRLDKMARGGRKSKKPHVVVNVMNQPHPMGPGGMAVPPVGPIAPMPPGMPPAGLAAGPRPPMAAPPGPGLPGAPRPPGMKRGGALGGRPAPHMEAGAGSGEGRLEKEEAQEKRKRK